MLSIDRLSLWGKLRCTTLSTALPALLSAPAFLACGGHTGAAPARAPEKPNVVWRQRGERLRR